MPGPLFGTLRSLLSRDRASGLACALVQVLGTGTSAEIEEERRLLYVAITRAKDDLHLVVPGSTSSFTASMRKAIAISMHHGRASFPKRCSDCSSKRLGRLRRPALRRGPPAKDPRWQSARMPGMWR